MRFGVDEAGKGPVLGSMFAAAVVAEPPELPDGVDDSKRVPPDRRRALEGAIRDAAADVAVVEVPVEWIEDPATDMNTLTVEAHVAALERVATAGLAGTVDAADTDADRFGRRVAARVDAPIDLEAAHGADQAEPLVGAASIVAKEAREHHVAELADEYGQLGSGYPGDPDTRAFLREYVEQHGTVPPCARSNWATARETVAAVDQAGLGDFEALEDGS